MKILTITLSLDLDLLAEKPEFTYNPYDPPAENKTGIKVSKALQGKAKTGRAAKGPGHHRSSIFAVRDAAGQLWYVRNVQHFCRTHQGLFNKKDAKESQVKVTYADGTSGTKSGPSIAAVGLSDLKLGHIHSWKGWTLAAANAKQLAKLQWLDFMNPEEIPPLD